MKGHCKTVIKMHNCKFRVIFIVLSLALLKAACFQKAEDSNITTIYLVSSCHLDVGFANTAANIVNEYFDKYFPAAIENAKTLTSLGGEEGLVFTTHSFLVYLYLNCDKFPADLGLHCPSQSAVSDFKDAVKRGDIVWHAFPFNSQMEVYDVSLAEFGFKLTHMLDKEFGLPPKITMSQRDVPGTTRSLIPIMDRNGIKAITVGVNGASMPPAVPSAFLWKDPTSGSEVIGMWHPHGYGGLDIGSIVIIPGYNEALAFGIRGDNSGPPSVTEVKKNYAILKSMFPNATIVASGYDAFVNKLVDSEAKSQLTVYTDEIGDTWIHGAASDPWKTAVSREIMRQRSSCITSGDCSTDSESLVMFSTLLLKNGEHTWGKDVKKYLHDTKNWQNDELRQHINDSNFVDMVKSWIEQRNWGFNLSLLEQDNPLRDKISTAIDDMKFDGSISTDGYTQETDIGKVFLCGGLNMKFSRDNGIELLEDIRTKRTKQYADIYNILAQFKYQTFTTDDYAAFFSDYMLSPKLSFIPMDFGKPGLPKMQRVDYFPCIQSIWFKEDSNKCEFLVKAEYDPPECLRNATTDLGAPKQVWTQYSVPKINVSGTAIEVNITLYIVNKTTTRIPESLSLYFKPEGVDPTLMTVSKLGEYIGVLDVLKNGSKHLHASDRGIAYGEKGLKFESLDTSVVCIGYPTPFPTPMKEPSPSLGFSFNIYNNIWGTNYIMWYPYLPEDASSKYRFKMTIPG